MQLNGGIIVHTEPDINIIIHELQLMKELILLRSHLNEKSTLI